MKYLLPVILLPLILCSCAQPGIRIYGPTSSSSADGSSSQGSALLAAYTADMVGVQSIPTPNGPIVFDTSVGGVRRVAILDKSKTQVIGYTEEPIVAGVYVSEANRSLGDAFSKGIRSIGSVIGTTLAGFAGIEAANAAGSALGTGVSGIVQP